ncbi:hypothetical protein BDW75DRAFT_229990 [Aspergillus navahoensis]
MAQSPESLAPPNSQGNNGPERAVVTTCLHIFCLQSAETLGLSLPGGDRRCPACSMTLINPDDAALAVLQPTKDYKTSVLSRLDPDTIMECTGQVLQSWTYQLSQEIVYQEVRVKSLTDKYTNLNTQLDKSQSRIVDMQVAQEQLRKKDQELADMHREKCKKTKHHVSIPSQTPSGYQQRPYPVGLDGVEQLHWHQRSAMRAMPPPNGPVVGLRRGKPPIATLQHRTRHSGPPRPSTGLSQFPNNSIMLGRLSSNSTTQ